MATSFPTLHDLGSLQGKRVLIRVDFNVPVDEKGVITDASRIIASLPTIEYVLKQGGKAILLSHFGRPEHEDAAFSLQTCAIKLSELLQKPVTMAKDCIGDEVEALCRTMQPSSILLLENLRFHAAEEHPEKDPSFAAQLASLGDIYINDAFSATHRKHSSIYQLPALFPYAQRAVGLSMQKEIEALDSAFKIPRKPFYVILGGAKIVSKIGCIHALLPKIEALFIGGALANTFLKAEGRSIGSSFYEKEGIEIAKALIKECKTRNIPLYLPEDFVAASSLTPESLPDFFEGQVPENRCIGDIGPKTRKKWHEALQNAKTIFWNGPVGLFELPQFAEGTAALIKTMSTLSECTTVAGGGETTAAIHQLGAANTFTHLSLGGGATLEYLEKYLLPGIDIICSKNS